MTDDLLD